MFRFMPRVSGHALLPTFALLTAMILWSSSFIALKIAMREYHPLVLIFLRMTIASVMFGLLWRNFRHVTYRKGDWKLLLFMAFCEPCLYFVFEGFALLYTSASQAGMIVSVMPLLVAVAAFLYLGERLSRRAWCGFFVAIAGVIWLTVAGKETENAPRPLLGNMLEFFAMVSATGYIIAAKRLSAHYPPLFITAVQSWVGCIFFFPLAMLPFASWPSGFPVVETAAVLYLGIVVTLGGYGLYNYGVSKLPAGQASAWGNAIPVFTLIMGHLFLGDTLTAPQYAASVLVLAGVCMSQQFNAAPDTVSDNVSGTASGRGRGQ